MKKNQSRRTSLFLVSLAGALGFVLGFLGEERSARAEERSGVKAQYLERDTAYVFEDDPLDGAALGDDSSRIRVRPRGTRSVLLRPRVHFVRELLISAESI